MFSRASTGASARSSLFQAFGKVFESMSILIDKNTRVICQGFTGKHGTFHSEAAIAYGTKMVGGTSPGKGGSTHLEPAGVRHRRRSASRRPAPTRRVIYVPPPVAADAILRSDRRGDPADRLHHRGHSGARHGAGEARAVGLEVAADRTELPGRHDRPASARSASCRATSSRAASVGIVSRSGTLTYEAVSQTTAVGLGQTTCRRHRRRPGEGHRIHRRAGDVPGRPRPSRSS